MARTFFLPGRIAAVLALSALSFTACSNENGPVGSGSPESEHKHSHLAADDLYANFAELQAAEPNSYSIVTRDVENGNAVESNTIIFTPHGGGIEPGSTEIADAISNAATGPDYDYYSFSGVKSSGNGTLHITSTNFDEPTCEAMVALTNRTIAIHGCSSTSSIVYVGGRNNTLRTAIASELTSAGFTVSLTPPADLAGTNVNNICNRNSTGEGVQLEISKGMRQEMMTSLNSTAGRATSKTASFYSFVNAVRTALAE